MEPLNLRTNARSHGAGINNPTLSDLVRRIDYIDVNGKEQFVNMSDPTLLKAASGCFGLLGVVTYITFECDAMCTAVMRPVKLDVIDAIPPPPEMKDSDIPAPLRQKRTQAEKDNNVREFERRANEDFYAEWFWFPYSQQVWVNTWKTDTDTKNVVNYPSNAKTLYQVASTAIMNMAQEIGKHIHALQVAPQTQTSLLCRFRSLNLKRKRLTRRNSLARSEELRRCQRNQQEH